jgi:hypothetical protein
MKLFITTFLILLSSIAINCKTDVKQQLKANYFKSDKLGMTLKKGIMYKIVRDIYGIQKPEDLKTYKVNIEAIANADILSEEKFLQITYTFYNDFLKLFNNQKMSAFQNAETQEKYIHQEDAESFSDADATYKAEFNNLGFKISLTSEKFQHNESIEYSWEDYFNKEDIENNRLKKAKEELSKNINFFKNLNEWTEIKNDANKFKITIPKNWFNDRQFDGNEDYIVKQTYPDAIVDSVGFGVNFDKINLIGVALYVQSIPLMENETFEEHLLNHYNSPQKEELLIDNIKISALEYNESSGFKATYFYYALKGKNNNLILIVYNGYGDFYDLHKSISRKVINSLKNL